MRYGRTMTYLAVLSPFLSYSYASFSIYVRILSVSSSFGGDNRGREKKTNWLFRCRGSLTSSRAKETNLLSVARARLIDRATYADMCRDTYRKSCTHTAQPCSPSDRCVSATGNLNEPPGTRSPFFPPESPSPEISRFLPVLLFRGGCLLKKYKRGLLSDGSAAVTVVCSK